MTQYICANCEFRTTREEAIIPLEEVKDLASRLARANRQLARGERLANTARIQDQWNDMYAVSYRYALASREEALAAGLPDYYMVMYDMMVSWSANQLHIGYAASVDKWSAASDEFLKSHANFESIDLYYVKLQSIYDRENP